MNREHWHWGSLDDVDWKLRPMPKWRTYTIVDYCQEEVLFRTSNLMVRSFSGDFQVFWRCEKPKCEDGRNIYD